MFIMTFVFCCYTFCFFVLSTSPVFIFTDADRRYKGVVVKKRDSVFCRLNPDTPDCKRLLSEIIRPKRPVSKGLQACFTLELEATKKLRFYADQAADSRVFKGKSTTGTAWFSL